MARGRCKKPCAGCGKPPPEHCWEDRWSAATPLCSECKYAIKAHKKLTALAKKRLKGELKAVSIPPDSDPSWPNHDREHDSDKRFRHPFQEAFIALCRVLGSQCVDMPEETLLHGKNGFFGNSESFLAFEPETAAALKLLFEAVCNLSENAYREGLERGADMLQSLIQGDMTAQDVNEVICRYNKG